MSAARGARIGRVTRISNVVDVYIRYLRRKLGDPSPISTVRGAGYRFDPS